MRRPALAALLVASTWILVDPIAEAAPKKKPAPSAPSDPAASGDAAAGKAEAAQATKAMTAKQYGAAADGFESAFAASQNYKYLFQAAQARQKNGETAKAANQLARYLKEAPPTAKDRAAAQAALTKAAAKLGQLVVDAKGASSVSIDGEEAPSSMLGAPIYTLPGSHNVEAKFAEGPASQSATAFAGQKTSVVLVHPDPPPPTPTVATREDGADGATGGDGGKASAAGDHHKPLPPAVVYVGAGITVAAGAFAVIEGLSVKSKKKAFDADPTQANLDAGKKAQTLTNVALVVTGVAAVATLGSAIFLVDWKGKDKDKDKPKPVEAGFGFGSIAVRGTF